MKINWKVRFSNPLFIFQVFIAIAMPIGMYFGVTGSDITSWGSLVSIILDALSNPYVLFTIVVSVYNSINDPTVSGVSDSQQSLKYRRPRNNRE